MQFVCNLCEVELITSQQSELPISSKGCTHNWRADSPSGIGAMQTQPEKLKFTKPLQRRGSLPSALAANLQHEAENRHPHLIVEARAEPARHLRWWSESSTCFGRSAPASGSGSRPPLVSIRSPLPNKRRSGNQWPSLAMPGRSSSLRSTNPSSESSRTSGAG